MPKFNVQNARGAKVYSLGEEIKFVLEVDTDAAAVRVSKLREEDKFWFVGDELRAHVLHFSAIDVIYARGVPAEFVCHPDAEPIRAGQAYAEAVNVDVGVDFEALEVGNA